MPNSARVTPTKIQMRTFEITQYQVNGITGMNRPSENSGLKYNHQPEDGTSGRYPAVKDSNSKMHSITDLDTGSQMDFQSVKR